MNGNDRPRKVVLASRNPGKLRELRELLEPHGFEVLDVSGFSDAEVEETAPTFLENALIKARAAALASGLPAIADDSGLEVDALGGAPGVFSARYAGEGATDEANVAALLGAAGRAGGRRQARVSLRGGVHRRAPRRIRHPGLRGRLGGADAGCAAQRRGRLWLRSGVRRPGHRTHRRGAERAGRRTASATGPGRCGPWWPPARRARVNILAEDNAGRSGARASGRRRPCRLYVHLPWCVRKCPYCDFNSHAARGGCRTRRSYVDALLADLEPSCPRSGGAA